MANSNTITGSDTLTLFDRVFVDIADGDASMITFTNELFNLATGKGGNSVYTKNEAGNNADMNLRLIMNSGDDRFLQQKLKAAQDDFASQELISGQFVKRIGDGEGGVTRNVYDLEGGIFVNKVDVKENLSGDTEQAVSVYRLRFARVNRSVE